MVNTNQRALPSEAFDGFAALFIAAIISTHFGYPELDWDGLWRFRLTIVDCLFACLFVLAWRYCFTVLKLYDKFATVRSRMGAALKGVLVMVLPFFIFVYFEHPHLVTRRGIFFSVLALFCYEVNRISLSHYLLDRLAARNPRRALIVGSGRRAAKAWRAIRTRYPHSIQLAGFVDNRDTDEMAPDVARRCLGQVKDLSEILLQQYIDVVLIAMPIRSCYPQMQEAVTIAEAAGVTTVYLDDIYSLNHRGTDPNRWIFRELASSQEGYLFTQGIKRSVDIFCASLALLLFTPLLLLLALTLLLTGGRAIERTECYGYRRRRFEQLRFRTSDSKTALASAENPAPQAELLRGQQRYEQPTLTPMGRFLRTTSLEKLPQLWNVLRGHMSLVGPQALAVHRLSDYDQAALPRHFSVRPGITGIRQFRDPSEHGWAHETALDNNYLDQYSLLLDVKILIRAVGGVIRRCSVAR